MRLGQPVAQVLTRRADSPKMSISAVSGSSTPAALAAERTVLVLKKQRDVAQDQAQALIALVKQASSPDTGRLIDVRA